MPPSTNSTNSGVRRNWEIRTKSSFVRSFVTKAVALNTWRPRIGGITVRVCDVYLCSSTICAHGLSLLSIRLAASVCVLGLQLYSYSDSSEPYMN